MTLAEKNTSSIVEAAGAGAPAGPPRLAIRDLSFGYGAQMILKGVDFSLRDGEFVALLGLSGCGKSTLLKLVAGLMKHSAGAIELSGRPISGPQGDIGMVFQKPLLLPWRNVRDNVLLPAGFKGRAGADEARRADELIRMVGLSSWAEAYPHQLSGGMAQRVGIARMLLHNPTLWLLDEPFAALDALTRENLSMELQSLWAANRKTALFVTHSIPEAVLLADRIVILGGRPAKVVIDMTVDLPRERTLQTMADQRFNAIAYELRVKLEEMAATGAT